MNKRVTLNNASDYRTPNPSPLAR